MSCPCDRGRPLGRSLTWLCTESSCLRARLDDGGCKVDPYGNGGTGALRSSRGPWRPGGSYSARRAAWVLHITQSSARSRSSVKNTSRYISADNVVSRTRAHATARSWTYAWAFSRRLRSWTRKLRWRSRRRVHGSSTRVRAESSSLQRPERPWRQGGERIHRLSSSLRAR